MGRCPFFSGYLILLKGGGKIGVRMKIIILGAGNRGFQIARHLIEEKKDVVLIESDPKKAAYATSKLDCLVINGSGTSIDVLREAGIEDADMFITMTDSDEVNMVACGLVSSEFNVPSKIASIRNLTYIGSHGLSGKILGIDYIVNPEAEAAAAIYDVVDKGVFSDMISFQKTDLLLNNVHVTADSSFLNKDIKTIRKAIGENFLVAAIHRKHRLIVPSGDTVVKQDDTLSIVSGEGGMEKVFNALGQKKKKLKKILLVGGSKTARFLLNNFSASDRKSFALVDQDPEVCKNFAEQFPEILSIKADVTDESLYEEEDIASYDLIITLTENDELNILTAIYAKKVGVDKAMALIKHNNNYLRLAPHLDLDSVIAVSRSTVNSTLRYIRGENFTSVHSLFEGKLEIFEFEISSDTPVVNKLIKDINLRNKGLIAGITRQGVNIVPTGDNQLKEGDVILVTVERNFIDYVQKLFK